MSVRKKTITYRCTSVIPEVGDDFVKVQQFKSEIDRSCEIIIWWKQKKNFTSRGTTGGQMNQGQNILNIMIEKTDEKIPAKVNMSLHITPMSPGINEETISIDKWMKYCYFRDWPVWSPSTRTLREIVLEITWTITESSIKLLYISDFFLNDTFSDVTIVIGDVKLFCHRMVLGAASPVMLSMLMAPMKEATEGCIVIKDVEVEVMIAILRILYTGKDDDLDKTDIAIGALIAAEKYNMQVVKELCEQKLIKNLNATNVLKILDVADSNRANNLREEALTLVVIHMKEIVHTRFFLDICVRKPLLVQELIIKANFHSRLNL